jgi:alcohol dehydrogenase
MSHWFFHNPTRVNFGENALESIGDIVSGERVAVVTTPGFRKRGVVKRIEELMKDRVVRVLDVVAPNPSMDSVRALGMIEGLENTEVIVALGGGSALDTGKALSRILSSDRGQPLSNQFWEGVGVRAGKTTPVVAIPTTAGTGSEVTPTATIWDYQNRVKRSLRGEDLYPLEAIVDPVLTYGLPEELTVSSGLDTVSHALESIWSKSANPMNITFATKALRLSFEALPRLKTDMDSHRARTMMMQASLMGGLAISQTRTALAHSMSYPLTIDFGIPHGIACSFALPEILEFNALCDDGRLQTLAAETGCETVTGLVRELRGLLDAVLSDTSYVNMLAKISATPDLAGRMLTEGRWDNNLRPADPDDVNRILTGALGRYSTRH